MMGDELMTAEINNQFPALSMMTLAFLEDTYWYQCDYRRASPFVYGAHMGCQFAQTVRLRIENALCCVT
jgi:hypothetical protein